MDPIPRHASDINCNFPSIAILFNIPGIDLGLPVPDLIELIPAGGYMFPPGGVFGGGVSILAEDNTAEALIDSYGQNNFIDDALPDWYLDAIKNPPPLQTLVSGLGNLGNNDDKAPKLIESLPICKEQDPSVVSYGKSPLATVLGK